MSHKELNEIREVTYVAVPYSEYKRLINSQQEVKKLQEQLHHHLKYKPIPGARREEPAEPTDDKPKVPASDVSEISAESKSGGGEVNSAQLESAGPESTAESRNPTSEPVPANLIQTIVSMVLQQLPAAYATGRGNEDLTPEPPGALPITTVDPLTAKVTPSNLNSPQSPEDNGDDDDNNEDGHYLDDFDRKLIDTVRNGARQQATILLKKLKNHSSDIHFNSDDGSIYIDGQVLPDANIFDIFKYLFKPGHYGSHNHLQTVVNEIASLGYGYLLSRHYLAGLVPRGKNVIKNRHEIHRHLKERGLPWYHVGSD